MVYYLLSRNKTDREVKERRQSIYSHLQLQRLHIQVQHPHFLNSPQTLPPSRVRIYCPSNPVLRVFRFVSTYGNNGNNGMEDKAVLRYRRRREKRPF